MFKFFRLLTVQATWLTKLWSTDPIARSAHTKRVTWLMTVYEKTKEYSLFFWTGGYRHNGLHNIKGVSINAIDISIALQHKSLPTTILRFSPPPPSCQNICDRNASSHQTDRRHSMLTAQQCGSLNFQIARDIRTWKCFSSDTPFLWN